jgi:rod shape determining protein RodA
VSVLGPTAAPLHLSRQGRPTLARRAWRRAGRVDAVLAGCVLALATIGALLVWSATRVRLADAGEDPRAMLWRHLVYLAVGLGLGAVVACADYRRLRVLAPVGYLLAAVGLVLVAGPAGAEINGSRSWIVVAGLSVQPVEFAKVALCLGLAVLLAERREIAGPGEDGSGFRNADVFVALGLAAVPVGLVLLQPDVGSAAVLLAVVAGVLVVAAVPARWILGLVATAVAGAVVAVQAHVLSEYQVHRFAAFTNPALDPLGVGYNVNQARIAIGSGGLTGTGLFSGTQTGGQFVPEQHTDFIFTVAGEELGLLGAGAVIVLFGLLLWRGCVITRRAPDLFGTLACTGVVCWLGFQTFQNIGMALGIMPVTGLPLPFVSYGGSAMLANLAAVGLLLNVHARSRR